MGARAIVHMCVCVCACVCGAPLLPVFQRLLVMIMLSIERETGAFGHFFAVASTMLLEPRNRQPVTCTFCGLRITSGA